MADQRKIREMPRRVISRKTPEHKGVVTRAQTGNSMSTSAHRNPASASNKPAKKRHRKANDSPIRTPLPDTLPNPRPVNLPNEKYRIHLKNRSIYQPLAYDVPQHDLVAKPHGKIIVLCYSSNPAVMQKAVKWAFSQSVPGPQTSDSKSGKFKEKLCAQIVLTISKGYITLDATLGKDKKPFVIYQNLEDGKSKLVSYCSVKCVFLSMHLGLFSHRAFPGKIIHPKYSKIWSVCAKQLLAIRHWPLRTRPNLTTVLESGQGVLSLSVATELRISKRHSGHTPFSSPMKSTRSWRHPKKETRCCTTIQWITIKRSAS